MYWTAKKTAKISKQVKIAVRSLKGDSYHFVMRDRQNALKFDCVIMVAGSVFQIGVDCKQATQCL